MRDRSWVLLVMLLAGRPAFGDAVPPPPADCSAGQVPVTDHQGPRCEPGPPRACPPGWLGQVGGTCTLHLCEKDSDCANGHCVPHSLCFEQHYCNPRSCDEGVRTSFSAERLCGRRHRCAAPDQCRPGKLCLPNGIDTPGDYPPRGKENGASPGAGGCAGCRRPQSSATAFSAMVGLLFAGVILRRRGR
jgi:hypothetical protein